MDRYEISEVNLGKNEYICFNFFEVWVLNFSLKEETMKNIHNQNVAELVHHAGGRYLLWGYRDFCLAFIFFRTFEDIASPLNSESSWQPLHSNYSFCLMEWPAKDTLTSLKPLVFENRMDLVLSSPKWIDSLLSINHWYSVENYLFKIFSIFLASTCW